MDNTNYDTIVRMFYIVQLTEPLIEAKGNEEIKKATKELKAAIITYLYSCKMSEEAEPVSERLAWTLEVFKYLHILEVKTIAFNKVLEDWKRNE